MAKHIEIDDNVHKLLKTIGKKGETYSDIIDKILKQGGYYETKY